MSFNKLVFFSFFQKGNIRTSATDKTLVLELSESPEGLIVSPPLSSYDGAVYITITAKAEGSFQLSALLDGKEIVGSPVTVLVRKRKKLPFCLCIRSLSSVWFLIGCCFIRDKQSLHHC